MCLKTKLHDCPRLPNQSLMNHNGWKILLFCFHNILVMTVGSDAGCLEYLMVFSHPPFGSESRHQTCVGLVSLQRKQLTNGNQFKHMCTTIHDFALSFEPVFPASHLERASSPNESSMCLAQCLHSYDILIGLGPS